MEVHHASAADVNEVIELALRHRANVDGIFDEDGCAPRAGAAPSMEYESLVESCFLSLVLKDAGTGEVIGAASLNDVHPMYTDGSAAAPWLRSELEVLGHGQPETFLYITHLILPRENRSAALAALVRAAFSYNHLWQAFLAVVPCTAKDDVSRLLSDGFSLLTQDEEDLNIAVFECTRTAFLNPVLVRRARVEDYDDLLPVLESAAKRYPQLSTIPTDESDVQEFALARLISSPDPHRVVLVAERGGGGGGSRIEGMVVLSDEVDVERLSAVYDLAEYDNLVERRPVVAQAASNGGGGNGEKRVAGRQHRGMDDGGGGGDDEDDDDGGARGGGGGVGQLSGDALIEALAKGELEGDAGAEAAPPGQDGDAHEGSHGGDEGRVLGGDALLEDALRLAAKEDEEGEEKEEGHGAGGAISMGDLDLAESETVPKAITMPMVCVDDALTDVADAFLTESFNCFPDKTYCTMTFPHSSAVPLMLSRFNSTETKLPETGIDMLYVAHRRASLTAFEVRRAELSDMNRVEEMLGGRPDKLEAFSAFRDALEGGGCVLATCGGEIVGIACVETASERKDELLARVIEAYSPQRVFDLRNTDEDSVGLLRYFLLGPLFGIRRRAFLVETLRVLGLSCILGTVDSPSGGACAEAVPEMVQLPAKGGSGGGGSDTAQPSGSLVYALSRKLAYRSPSKVNSRIVVVGASDAGLAAIESLLVSTEYTFTSLTLVCNNAHPGTADADPARRAALAKLAMEVNLRIIDDAEMAGLDREEHSIGVAYADGSAYSLPYEVLLLTPDLRDQTCTGLGINAASARDSVMRFEDLKQTFDGRRAARTECAIVYGNTVEAYRALHHLLGSGVPADRIVWMRTPATAQAASGGSHAGSLGDLVYDSMERAGITGALEGVRRCVPGTIRGLDVNEDDRVVVDYLAADSDASEALVCDVLVTCDLPNTDINVFESINDAGIVYDGRVVVNASFQTNDRDVYAAGEVAKFSRGCSAGDVSLEHFNGVELGGKLAASLMARFKEDSSSSIADVDAPEPAPYPTFARSRCVRAMVPGPGKFFIVGRPEAFFGVADVGGGAGTSGGGGMEDGRKGTAAGAPPTTALERHIGAASDRCIWTDIDGYTCIMLDGSGRIESVLYCGKMDVDMEFMHKIIGLLPEHLNDMGNQYRAGAIASLPKFFAQPWADAVHHPEFLTFKRELYESVRACLADYTGPGGAPAALGQDEAELMDGVEAPRDGREAQVIKLVQESMMDFIRAYKEDLPGYHVQIEM